MFLRRFVLCLLLFLFCLGSMSKVFAACGLQGCPSISETETKNRLVIDNQLTFTKFNLEHRKGDYVMFTPHIHYYGWSRFVVGGFASLVNLDDGHETNTGFGNPVIYGEYVFSERDSVKLSAGTQIEFPLGDDDKGIAGDHTAVLPYLGYRQPLKRIGLFSQVGYRHSFSDSSDGHAGGGHTPLLVNPHGDKEFVYRAGVEKMADKSGLFGRLNIDGQHVIDGDDEGKGFLTANGYVGSRVGDQTRVGLLVELPVSNPRRFDSRVGLNLVLNF